MAKGSRDLVNSMQSRWQFEPYEDVILVEVRNLPTQVVVSSILGHTFNQKKKVRPILVASNFPERERTIYGAFGYNEIESVRPRDVLKESPWLVLKTFLSFLMLMLNFALHRFDLAWFFANANFLGVRLGDQVFDAYIRHGHYYRHLSRGAHKFLKLTFVTYLFAAKIDRLFKQHKVKSVLISQMNYASVGAIMGRMALARGIPAMIATGGFARLLTRPDEATKSPSYIEKHSLEKFADKIGWHENIQAYLAKRFSGDIDQHDVRNAFKDKKTWSREQFFESLKLEKQQDKPIVFLMLHVFSDANHGAGSILFRSWFEWYVETLEQIKHIKDVVWLVKPHPSSYMFHEEGIAEEVIQPYLSENILLCPKELSTISVFNVANAVITINGTIGLEAACMGLPVILAGEGLYSGLGFTIEPASIDDYNAILRNIRGIQKLSDEQVRTARMALHRYHVDSHPETKIIPQVAVDPGKSNLEYEDLFEHIYGQFAETLVKFDYREDNFFRKVESIIVDGKGSVAD
jgi:hypothetical protein